MVSQTFHIPTTFIMIIIVFGLLLILISMVVGLAISEEVCLAAVDKATPSFMDALPDNIRPLKAICRILK